MDKYTVDLDKVLNDFEYSELTDHYGVSDASQNTNATDNSYTRARNTEAKHSINNVFTSLDEYINSDIGGSCDVVAAFPFKNGFDDHPPVTDVAEDQSACEEEKDDVILTPLYPTEKTKGEAAENAPGSLLIIETVTDHPPENAENFGDESDENEEQMRNNNVTNECIEAAAVEEPKLNAQKDFQLVAVDDESMPVETELEECEANEKGDHESASPDEEAAHDETVRFDGEVRCDDSELDKYLDELENELAPFGGKKVGKDEEMETKIEATRPASLDLNGEKHEINLIGDPGSTPYNNIYVTKELPAAVKRCESDTEDTSRSASPTFSDISSDCTGGSTTPSTETVNEEEIPGKRKEEEESTDSAARVADCIRDETSLEADANFTNEIDAGCESVVAENSPENVESETSSHLNSGPGTWLGKQAPLWIPDSETPSCLHCDMKFTVIKRRHHCRACGLVLCSKCCNMRFRLEYLDSEARVCVKCFEILSCAAEDAIDRPPGDEEDSSSRSVTQPNPNNPMEYCSVVPPLQQVGNVAPNPPSVMVPVSVLKRKGSNKARSTKSVMFYDGIRPGSDLTNLDIDFDYTEAQPSSKCKAEKVSTSKANRDSPNISPNTRSFIPDDANGLPPTVTVHKTDVTYSDCSNGPKIVETLRKETLTFALQRNLLVHVGIINMSCCINKVAWCFSTEGLINVGQDEIVYLLEVIEDEEMLPKDMFLHINSIYIDAVKGTTVKEMGISLHNSVSFLDSKNHSGFLYIKPTFQCLQNVIKPKEIYLIGILIHKWETPWAKIFPLRLVLRLGAEYRYYPSPIISTRNRESVFVEIGHTIINLLADFRNFSYTLPQIRGLTIHMEEKNTTVMVPSNRYEQVMKSLNNSSDHILAFAGNFSTKADSHLVCIQDTCGNDENSYTTHAINIHNKPRKVTGASFIVFNGALKSTSGLTAKSSIVEDGLMIQIPADDMVHIRESLRSMKDHTIQCGVVNTVSDESVTIVWGEPDANFNVGVTSPIDDRPLAGVPSIRVHNGKDYICNGGGRLIRWTEVFILQNSDEGSRSQDPVDVSKIAESVSKAACQALVKYLDLLCTNSFYKIGVRANLHVENVSYCAGGNSVKLPPIYMKSLDNELVPVLHRITTNNLGENTIILELIFRILNV